MREALDAANIVDDPLPRERYLEAAQLYRTACRDFLGGYPGCLRNVRSTEGRLIVRARYRAEGSSDGLQ